MAARLKALGHPVRIRIIRQLIEGGQSCCGEICNCMPHAQSTISQHLDSLKRAGLVRLQPEGTRSLYSVDREALAALSTEIAMMARAGMTGDRHDAPDETIRLAGR